MNRRSFLQALTGLATLTLLPFQKVLAEAKSKLQQWLNQLSSEADSPLQRVSLSSSIDFNGDNPERNHNAFWDLKGYLQRKGGIPQYSETCEVVIAGGGAAGLCAAYKLKDRKALLLEQNSVFGGNSRGELIEGQAHSIGGAYLGGLSDDGEVMKLVHELGLTPWLKTEPGHETTVFYKGQFQKGFWDGVTDPSAQSQFQKILREFQLWSEDETPDSIPYELDRISFQKWLEQKVGKIHPHLLEYFQLYCWSSFLCSVDEVSASQALGFIVPETSGLVTFPGGLSAITAALHQKLVSDLGRNQVRSSCMVLDVRQDAEWVYVCYENPTGALKTVRAKACVMASPKYVAKHIVQDLPAAQLRDMSRIGYRSYLVGNIILDRPIRAPSFELYCLQGETPRTPSATRPSTRTHTDICFASWANDSQGRGTLTIYNGMAFDGARGNLFAPFAHEKFKNRMIEGATPILKKLGLSTTNISVVRMTRWGHALPLAVVGALADGYPQRAHEPFGRVFFANQDNWVNPCFDTALEAGFEAAELVTDKI